MKDEVSVTIKRNLRVPGENRMMIWDPEGTEYNFPIGPNIHVQTDGRWLSFHVEVGGLHDEDSRARFIRAIASF